MFTKYAAMYKLVYYLTVVMNEYVACVCRMLSVWLYGWLFCDVCACVGDWLCVSVLSVCELYV